MSSKESPGTKYVRGNTNETEDTDNHNVSQSFELTSRGEEIKPAIVIPPKHRGRHYGASVAFFWVDGEPYFTIGPHWPFFLCMWTCLIVVGILVNYYVSGRQSAGIQTLAFFITLWQAFIYLFTALKNPGIVTAKNPDDPKLEEYIDFPNFCNACKVLKDEDTYHCFDCDNCIKGYDHHCPWTGKCIGQGNLIPFYTFLFSTVGYIVFCILMTVNSL